MKAEKRTDRIVWIAVAVVVLLVILARAAAPRLLGDADLGISMEYETRLFDTAAPLTIDIQMDADAWQGMLDTADGESYSRCDVVINGETFQVVGIRPEGESALSGGLAAAGERPGLRLKFASFVKRRKAWGLDELCLVSGTGAACLKQALVFDMYAYLGADAPLYNYAAVYVNGEYWGLCLALEAVNDSFLVRNYGVSNAELYRPDVLRAEALGITPPEEPAGEDAVPTAAPTAAPDPRPPAGEMSSAMRAVVDAREEAREEAEDALLRSDTAGIMDGGGPGGFGGVDLNYLGEELDSYALLWACDVTKTDVNDHRRVVKALRHDAEGTELETYLDVDNLLRYMAVHNFSVNPDSLSGGAARNYYLYEGGGRLNLLPWGYEKAFGGDGEVDASAVINEPIDEPWRSTHFFDCLLEDGAYLATYHEYYRQLVEEYILGGGFDTFYERSLRQISALAAASPDTDDLDAAAESLYWLVKLRAENVLSGLCPQT